MILAGDVPALVTTTTGNVLEMKQAPVEYTLHTMAKVRDFMEMWLGSQIMHDTQQQSCTQNNQMTSVGYKSDT